MDAAVKPRTWTAGRGRNDPDDPCPDPHYCNPCPDSRYCAPNVSYVHAPLGQEQASIRDEFCHHVNVTNVFGGAWTSFSVSGDARRTAPLVKPEIEDDGTWRRQGEQGEWRGAGGQAESGWEEQGEEGTPMAPRPASDDPGEDYRTRYNEWLDEWDRKLRYMDPTHTDDREGTTGEFAAEQAEWEAKRLHWDWWRGFGCDTKGCGEYPHPYKQPMGGGAYEAMDHWAQVLAHVCLESAPVDLNPKT